MEFDRADLQRFIAEKFSLPAAAKCASLRAISVSDFNDSGAGA
jgi:hypothetical protein